MSNRIPEINEARTVREVIDRMAEIRADEHFLIDPETNRTLTFRELRQRAVGFSRRLLSLGVSKGDRVSFLLDNGLFSLEMILGAMYGGFVPAPLNLAAGQSTMASTLNHSDATVVFVADEYKDLLSGITTDIQRRLKVIPVHPDHGPEWSGTNIYRGSLPALDEQDDVLLLYTSGTTGRPKGALYVHRNLLAAAVNAVSFYELSGQDRSLCVLPIYHINGLAITSLPTLLSGGSLVIPRRFNVASFWNWVVTYRCTWFALVPTIISQLVNRTAPHFRGGRTDLSRVRFARSSSAPIAPSLHRAFEEKFGLPLFEAMGMTEVGDILSTPPSLAKRKIGSPGIPRHEAKFVDALGRDLPPHQIGEMVCRGPSVMKGYHKDPVATAAALSPNGWLKTGDLGYKDEDGYFFITGREKEIIIKGGENVSPREIDETLESHPAVLEAAAVGVPDRYLGEEIIAYVVLKPGTRCQEHELLVFCARALGDFKTPTRIYFTDDLPKGPSGKLQRLKLLDRKEIQTDVERDIGTSALYDAQSRSQRGFVEPRTSLETQLAAIWTTLLQVTRVGIHDDFFALGGHSLLAARILARVRDAFQVSLSIRVLFEAPTVAKLARRIEMAKSQGQGLQPLAIQSSPNEGASSLSFPQERLWFLDLFESGSVEYNIAAVRRFSGNLVIQALEDSFTEIIRRHASLRTTFPALDGQPFQSIASPKPFRLTVVELSALPEEKKRTEVARLAKQEALHPFDLTRGPLLRAILLRLNEDEHVLSLTVHHIVSDRWSMEVLFWELGVLYSAFSENRASPLSELPIQYADLAAWQRQWLQGEILERQLAYWKQQLAHIPHLLELPFDRPRPTIQTHRGAHQFATFPISLAQALNELSRREQVTLFMTLLAGFQTLLFRYSGQEDIVIGSPTANRTRTETENLIGFFINMLVLRADLSGNPTFRELLQRVQTSALSAYEHQDIPFEKLVAELRPARLMSQSPLFQVVFHLRNVPERTAEFSNLQMEVLKYDSGTAQLDLGFSLRETADGLEVEVEYNTDLFDAGTIERMLGHFQTLLEGVAANPEQRISELPLLTEAEKHQLLVEWNDTKTDYPKDKCIHELFETQVERTPDAIALAFEDQQLTYHELNNRANQLAHYLQTLGVGPAVLVGICVERSMEMIVGLLGILKAGGAYVPLDPTYPKERLGFMLEDTHVGIVLTDIVSLTSLPPTSARVICLDRDWEEVAREPQVNRISQSRADSLAYVIYTSGSTGQPKGVAVSHRAVNRLVMNTDYAQVTPSQVMAQVSNVSFDAATFEIWGALLNGARLVLIAKDTLLSPRSLLTAVERHRITTLFLTTALFNQMVEQIPAALGRLRHLLFGGEAVDPRVVKKLLHKGPPRRLLHVYGPTETTTFASWYLVKAVAADATTVPIGRPIGGTDIYILDKYLAPVPIGVPGELHIGGDGLARGYLNRPELTREKFIANPFSADPTSRLYKTGDVARYLPDGNIEFLGRINDQVKLRGHRIELGEIEMVLGQHRAIQNSVAVVREGTSGDKRLVAYVVARPEGMFDAADVRKYLKQKLPKYMIPSAVVLLDELPLTANGKVDRNVLPAPDRDRPELEYVYQAGRTPIEDTLAGIWAEVLKVDKIGIYDNFFDLGGHSLLATQIVSRIRNVFSIELPLRHLFESPTVAEIAVIVTESQAQPVSEAALARMLSEVEVTTEEERRKC
jgi:amino acid adenylation domain-containing protein